MALMRLGADVCAGVYLCVECLGASKTYKT